MPCPQCGLDACSCAAARPPSARPVPRISFSYEHEPELVDPETHDDSEQMFEDSLMSSPVTEYRSIQLGPERDQQSINSQIVQNAVAAEDHSVAYETRHRAQTGIERHAVEESSADERCDNWRDEISSRLNNYAKRRGRKQLAGAYSMQLDFERPRHSNAATAPALNPVIEEPLPEPVTHVAEPLETAIAPEPQPEPEWNPAITTVEVASGAGAAARALQPSVEPVQEHPKRRQHRIIEFPRLFPIEQVETSPDELAEPLNRPRILDVPEETDQIVLPLGDISMEMQEQAAEETPVVPDSELPIQVAGMSQRVFAAIADCVIVLFATALFTGVVLNIAKDLPHNKLTLMAAIVIPAVFWALYYYFFLVHAAKTPGMQVAQLRIASFNGRPTTRQIRRARALGLVLSLVSAGMGFGWAFVDEDTLCWHDRISRTYLAHRR